MEAIKDPIALCHLERDRTGTARRWVGIRLLTTSDGFSETSAMRGPRVGDGKPCQNLSDEDGLTEAQRYIEPRDAMLADFDERWRAMTPAQREQARREAQKGG